MKPIHQPVNREALLSSRPGQSHNRVASEWTPRGPLERGRAVQLSNACFERSLPSGCEEGKTGQRVANPVVVTDEMVGGKMGEILMYSLLIVSSKWGERLANDCMCGLTVLWIIECNSICTVAMDGVLLWSYFVNHDTASDTSNALVEDGWCWLWMTLMGLFGCDRGGLGWWLMMIPLPVMTLWWWGMKINSNGEGEMVVRRLREQMKRAKKKWVNLAVKRGLSW